MKPTRGVTLLATLAVALASLLCLSQTAAGRATDALTSATLHQQRARSLLAHASSSITASVQTHIATPADEEQPESGASLASTARVARRLSRVRKAKPPKPAKRPPSPPPPSPPPPGPPPPSPPPLTPAAEIESRAVRPNFVVIMVDDLDELLNSTHPYYMPRLAQHFAARGTRLTNTLVSTGVCCPARVSALAGRLPHCTNVTGNSAPGGGYPRFRDLKVDRDWLPGWLQAAGYGTYLVGKFLNGYMGQGDPTPRGWTEFDALTLGTYSLYNSCFSRNGSPDTCYKGGYQTDIIRDKAAAYMRQAVGAASPFFMWVAPTAPHTGMVGGRSPPLPAARHERLYEGEDIVLPKGPSFNVSNPALPLDATPLTAVDVAALQELYLARLRSLRAVDDLIDALVKQLQALGVLDNTYLVFTSDNGIHLGQFTQMDGKALPVEEDARVPLWLRGPGLPAGAEVAAQANLADLAPTLLALAGLPIPPSLDGLPLPVGPLLTAAHVRLLAAATASGGAATPPALTAELLASWRRDTTVLEAWDSDAAANTQGVVFKSLRLCTPYRVFGDSAAGGAAARGVAAPGSACYKYNVWCSGTREFYDLSTDPFEVDNRFASLPRPVWDRLDALLSALAHCSGPSCRSPYAALHPSAGGQGVRDFVQAMDPSYDGMYGSLVKFRFRRCRPVYVQSNEPAWSLGVGPQPRDWLAQR